MKNNFEMDNSMVQNNMANMPIENSMDWEDMMMDNIAIDNIMMQTEKAMDNRMLQNDIIMDNIAMANSMVCNKFGRDFDIRMGNKIAMKIAMKNALLRNDMALNQGLFMDNVQMPISSYSSPAPLTTFYSNQPINIPFFEKSQSPALTSSSTSFNSQPFVATNQVYKRQRGAKSSNCCMII